MFQKDDGFRNSKDGIETIIGPTVKVNGNFSGSGDINVEGSVVGTLKTSKNLRIGQSAHVKADVSADNAFVAGEIRGNVSCKGKLELTATAKIVGNVEAQILVVASGAVLHGKCQMLSTEPKEMPVEMNDSTDEAKAKQPKK